MKVCRINPLVLCITVALYNSPVVYAEKNNNLSIVSGINIPPVFASVLNSGVSVPVRLKYINDDHGLGFNNDALNAMIQLDSNEIKVSYLDIKSPELFSDELLKILKEDIRDKKFENNKVIYLKNGSYLDLDLMTMTIIFNLTEESFAKKSESRHSTLSSSSIDSLTSVVSYNFGVSGNNLNDEINSSNTNSYLNIDSVTGLKEHNLQLGASAYNVGTNKSNVNVRKAVYVHDYNDRRLAFGILSGWDLQSLGQVSALNTKRIWGASYGNKTSSSVIDNRRSFTPIFAFLPSAGEVRIYKDQRLISIQNFGLGNHEIDTRSFPSGLYDIDVEVVVNSEVVSRTTQRVDKYSFFNQSDKLQWQLWGGFMELPDSVMIDSVDSDPVTYLAGASLAQRLTYLHLSGSAYSFNGVAVSEIAANFNQVGPFRLNNRLLVATDNSWRFNNSVDINLGKVGSLWISHEKGKYGEKLNRPDADNYGYGINLPLSSLYYRLGSLSASQRHDNINESKYLDVNYYQSLYSGKYGHLSTRLGYNEQKSSVHTTYNKSIGFELNIPLGQSVTAGVTSNNNGNTLANLGYRRQFDEGIIRSTGINLSTPVNSNDSDNKVSSSGYVNYVTDYLSGSVYANRSSAGAWSGSMTGNGRIGLTKEDVTFSATQGQSTGVLIKTGLEKDQQLLTTINGREYRLKGDKNLITLDAYQDYSIALHNSKDTKDSFEIIESKKEVTLYPGNIYTYDVRNSIKELITVFGVLVQENGEVIGNTRLDNHIGSTITDAQGEFVIDVDKKFPIVTARTAAGNICEADLDIVSNRGATWLGNIVCNEKNTYAKK